MLGFSGDRDEGFGPGIGSGAGIGEGFGMAGTSLGTGSLSGGGGMVSPNITAYDGSNAVSVTADTPSASNNTEGTMNQPGFIDPNHPGIVGGGYNANNMGAGMPGGAPGGPAQNPGAGQMPGGMVNGPMSEGGGEPLIRRLQGLTPQQQNYLLGNPNALRAFNQEYDRILQSGQAGSVGVGQMMDTDYQHGQYNVNAANTGGLISQGTNNDFGGGM